MKEEFLHYLWKYCLFDRDKLSDNEGNKISVIHPGSYNRDAGPDFFNARIGLSGTTWAGNVEIHTLASHFNVHGHQNDPAYDNVILHVVAEKDRSVFNSRGEEVLTAELSYDPVYYERYINLVNNPAVIACQDHLDNTDPVLVRQWLSSLAVERLEEKSSRVMKILDITGIDWEETFYHLLCRYFGFRVNSEPFEMMSNALPYKIIRKHADNLFQVEALLFGTAGMLEEGLFKEALSDEYYLNMIKEFKILSTKYCIQPLHGWLWKFSRLRPANFPTVRISQLARMLSTAGGLFSRVAEAGSIDELRALFEVPASGYWDNHFIFGKKSSPVTKNTGQQATELLVINAVIPTLFLYGRERKRQEICERSLEFLEALPAEHNIITAEWKSAGINAGSAFHSQALILLRNEYCKKRRCLECRIGNRLVSEGKRLREEDELALEP